MEGNEPSGKLLLVTVPRTFNFIESLKEGNVLVVVVDMEGEDTDTPLFMPIDTGPLREAGPLIDVCTPPEPLMLMFFTPWPLWEVKEGWEVIWPCEVRLGWLHIMGV